MKFSATIRRVGGVSIIDIAGALTSSTGQALSTTVAELLAKGGKNILLNLNAMDYVDSSGIGGLVTNYLRVIKAGGEMRVVGLTPRVEEILKITQLYRVFPDFHDEQAALNSFPSAPARGFSSPNVAGPVSKN